MAIKDHNDRNNERLLFQVLIFNHRSSSLFEEIKSFLNEKKIDKADSIGEIEKLRDTINDFQERSSHISSLRESIPKLEPIADVKSEENSDNENYGRLVAMLDILRKIVDLKGVQILINNKKLYPTEEVYFFKISFFRLFPFRWMGYFEELVSELIDTFNYRVSLITLQNNDLERQVILDAEKEKYAFKNRIEQRSGPVQTDISEEYDDEFRYFITETENLAHKIKFNHQRQYFYLLPSPYFLQPHHNRAHTYIYQSTETLSPKVQRKLIGDKQWAMIPAILNKDENIYEGHTFKSLNKFRYIPTIDINKPNNIDEMFDQIHPLLDCEIEKYTKLSYEFREKIFIPIMDLLLEYNPEKYPLRMKLNYECLVNLLPDNIEKDFLTKMKDKLDTTMILSKESFKTALMEEYYIRSFTKGGANKLLKNFIDYLFEILNMIEEVILMCCLLGEKQCAIYLNNKVDKLIYPLTKNSRKKMSKNEFTSLFKDVYIIYSGSEPIRFNKANVKSQLKQIYMNLKFSLKAIFSKKLSFSEEFSELYGSIRAFKLVENVFSDPIARTMAILAFFKISEKYSSTLDVLRIMLGVSHRYKYVFKDLYKDNLKGYNIIDDITNPKTRIYRFSRFISELFIMEY